MLNSGRRHRRSECIKSGLVAVALLALGTALPAAAQGSDTIELRGHRQSVRLYGPASGAPVIVSSGDGGWVHLAPQVAEMLGAKGFFVVGIDAKAYLASFTSRSTTLRSEDVEGDYRVLASYASRASGRRPVLVGVSEGAGLSVLAATDPMTKDAIAGVVALGMPDLSELGWRWRDSLIYLTHGIPNEPTFSVAAIIARVAPVPLAAIHSTNDEFVPLSQVEEVFQRAMAPKKLWVVQASDHRFSDNQAEFGQRLLEAMAWVEQNQSR